MDKAVVRPERVRQVAVDSLSWGSGMAADENSVGQAHLVSPIHLSISVSR